MHARSPVFTPKLVLPATYVVAICMIVLAIIIIRSHDPEEYRIRYDSTCEQQIHTRGDPSDRSCKVELSVKSSLRKNDSDGNPIDTWVYYEIDNMNANHRRFVQSFAPLQFLDENWTYDDIKSDCVGMKACDPEEDTDCDAREICGLLFNSAFNDTIAIMDESSNPVVLNTDSISWHDDKKKYYENFMKDDPEKRAHVQVWMRPPALNVFRQPYARINGGLGAGTYTIQINDHYDVSDFRGEKFVVVGRPSVLGTTDISYPVMLLVQGGILLVFSIVLTIVIGCVPRSEKFGRIERILKHNDALESVVRRHMVRSSVLKQPAKVGEMVEEPDEESSTEEAVAESALRGE